MLSLRVKTQIMQKNQKIILWGAISLFVALIALVIVLIVGNSNKAAVANEAIEQADSLRLANDQLVLTNEFNQLNADFSQYEDQQIYLKNDSLVQKYNQARLKVEGLIKELNAEKQSHNRDMAQSRAKIKQLEGEIATLKGIVRHYLEEIKRLGEENAGLKQEIEQISAKNEQLSTQYTAATTQNEQLTKTVAVAKRLTISGVSLQAYNKKGKVEKNVTKARQLGVSFTVGANNTAAPGMKTFYVRIISPEGTLLSGGGSFQMDGASIQATARRSVEYANENLPVSIYWDVNTSLTPGDYTVEVFCDGSRVGSTRATLKK